MKMKNVELETKLAEMVSELDFSGVIHVENHTGMIHTSAHGFSNRAESIPNITNTRFGIASGCKLFTAIAICQLVERGSISFQSKLSNLLDHSFPHFDGEVTVHHLLTHSSGIPDYFDEDEMDDFEELWVKNPMYHMRQLEDFLPLFQNQQMKFNPSASEKFHYNNAGYIVLGLIIEKVTGVPFTDFVEAHIFKPARMDDSGYFSLDRLPANTALGYIDKEDGSWKTNNYSIPIKGGADGGAYVTASDMAKLWQALMNGKLVSKEMLVKMLTPWIKSDNDYYGYGMWIEKAEDKIVKYHVMGYDPGVSFASGYYPDSEMVVVITSNKERGPHKLMYLLEEYI